MEILGEKNWVIKYADKLLQKYEAEFLMPLKARAAINAASAIIRGAGLTAAGTLYDMYNNYR